MLRLALIRQHELRRKIKQLPCVSAIRVVLTVCLILLGLSDNLFSADGDKKKTAPTGDLAAELPRVPGTPANRAVGTFDVHPDFEIQLVASEPLVHDPVAIAFDENSRMYVIELQPYNLYATSMEGQMGNIRLLEDSNGDGTYDQATTFLGDLKYPTGIACYDGGLFIGDAPHLLYCKDTDGDGQADLREVICTGFGTDKAGEAHLNTFRWGFDNRIHISTGLNGGTIRSIVDPSATATSVRGRGFILDPITRSYELTSGAGQYGMGVDDWGRKFVCENSKPAMMLQYDGRYLARNPYLVAPGAAVNIAPKGKFTTLHRISPPEPWRVVRTRMRKEGSFAGSDEGGTPFGFFTGATGITVYRGDAWPKQYRGNLFVGDVANNIVYRAQLKNDGLTTVAEGADPEADFVASRDIWFRPAHFANGPEGNLYVIDMYRELIEGAAFLPPDVLKHLDPASGYDQGRIYRLVSKGNRIGSRPQLAQKTTSELVALLDHQNGWHRDTASRLIYQRQETSAIRLLRKLVKEGKTPQGRMTAAYSLSGLNALAEEDVLALMSDDHPRVREQGARLSEQFPDSIEVLKTYQTLATDADARLRYQIAFSLGAMNGVERCNILAGIVERDGANPLVRMAVQSSLGRGAAHVIEYFVSRPEQRKLAFVKTFLVSLAEQVGAANRRDEIAALLKLVNRLENEESGFGQQLIRGMVSKQPKNALAKTTSGQAGELLGQLVKEAIAIASDENKGLKQREAAVRTLSLAKFDEVQELMVELLSLQQPQPIQAAALETLARFTDDGVAEIILNAWRSLSPKLRPRASETIFARKAWIVKFLDAIENERVSRADLDPARVQLLKVYPDETVKKRVKDLFQSSTLARRQQVVDAYQPALKNLGDPAKGRQLFGKVCSACHRLEGKGTAVGADLKGIRNRGLASVMLNILDPNREVKPKFLSYVVVTDAGQVVTGMIASENANSVTIRRVDGTQETILRVNIDELTSSGLSFMPEGLEKQITVSQMADLLAYLNSME